MCAVVGVLTEGHLCSLSSVCPPPYLSSTALLPLVFLLFVSVSFSFHLHARASGPIFCSIGVCVCVVCHTNDSTGLIFKIHLIFPPPRIQPHLPVGVAHTLPSTHSQLVSSSFLLPTYLTITTTSTILSNIPFVVVVVI